MDVAVVVVAVSFVTGQEWLGGCCCRGFVRYGFRMDVAAIAIDPPAAADDDDMDEDRDVVHDPIATLECISSNGRFLWNPGDVGTVLDLLVLRIIVGLVVWVGLCMMQVVSEDATGGFAYGLRGLEEVVRTPLKDEAPPRNDPSTVWCDNNGGTSADG
jgi:hypothetical protein